MVWAQIGPQPIDTLWDLNISIKKVTAYNIDWRKQGRSIQSYFLMMANKKDYINIGKYLLKGLDSTYKEIFTFQY